MLPKLRQHLAPVCCINLLNLSWKQLVEIFDGRAWIQSVCYACPAGIYQAHVCCSCSICLVVMVAFLLDITAATLPPPPPIFCGKPCGMSCWERRWRRGVNLLFSIIVMEESHDYAHGANEAVVVVPQPWRTLENMHTIPETDGGGRTDGWCWMSMDAEDKSPLGSKFAIKLEILFWWP